MKIKKTFIIFIVLTLLSSAAIVGCGSNGKASDGDRRTAAESGDSSELGG